MKRKKKTPVERKLAGASRYPTPTGEGNDKRNPEPARADSPILGKLTLDGQMLRAWREARGLTQRELGAMIDIPQNTITRWETAAMEIMHPRLLALALFGIDCTTTTRKAPGGQRRE